MPKPQAIAPVAFPVRMQALHSQPFHIRIPAPLLMLGFWAGSSLCPSAHSCPGTRSPSHRPRSSKAQISYSSICPLPTPAKCLAHTGNHAHVLAGGWASGSPQGSKSTMPCSHGAADCQHLTGNPVSGPRSVKEPDWSHRQRQGLGHSCLM